MKPTIGRIVHYSTTEKDQRQINEHATDTPREVLPAIIVSVDSENETVNLKVFTDGYRDLYVKEAKEGQEPGQYQWPVVEKTKEAKQA